MLRRSFVALACSSLCFSLGVAHAMATTPRIIPRTEWRADDALLYKGAEEPPPPETQIPADEGNGISERVKTCEEAQRLYPSEFQPARTVRKDGSGRAYRWPQSYSSQVKLLVVHHTALPIAGDGRSPLERVRALYHYHAQTLGWGDIGYNYIIDEEGQIYEGRAGGDGVVAGHVYCANVGTIGIALLGNFEDEEPMQNQIAGLQWLLKRLADQYRLDLTRHTTFHGKSLPVIVGHRDLVSTACPGFFLAGVLNQIRRNVLAGTLTAHVTFPPPLMRNYQDRTNERRSERLKILGVEPSDPTLTPLGATELTVRPGGQVTASLLFRAGSSPVQNRARIASVIRSSPRIGIWQQLDGENVRIREDLLLPRLLHEGEVETLRLRFQVPELPDTYTVDIGPLTFVLNASGRRTRSLTGESVPMTATAEDRINIPTPGSQRQTSSTSQASLASPASQTPIRIRLTARERNARTCAEYDLAAVGRAYRGTVTCTIVAGAPVLINELPLEDYLAGLGEEPDTEPYEKQRAFAVAARSYAAFYLDAVHRKFPGMPYDGDDSAARFQLYIGLSAESANPQWVRAVASTAGQVLTKDDGIVKAAYFSSDDGRTRSPAENGWKDFPFAEVFLSKPDPWCTGLPNAGHGVGMSGCGAKGQSKEGKKAEEILQYYYPGTLIESINSTIDFD